MPTAFIDNLGAYCHADLVSQMSGMHACEFCSTSTRAGDAIRFPARSERPALGSGEIRGWGKDGRSYAAPQMIFHYVVDHHYLPPTELIQALLSAPLPGSEEYAGQIAAYREMYNGLPVSARTSRGLAIPGLEYSPGIGTTIGCLLVAVLVAGICVAFPRLSVVPTGVISAWLFVTGILDARDHVRNPLSLPLAIIMALATVVLGWLLF